MTWKIKQCNFVCCPHIWMPFVPQTRNHMYVFLFKTVRERAASKGCSSVPVLAAEHFAIDCMEWGPTKYP